jgi:hypothetical protein
MTGYERISRRQFYDRGGFANPACVRRSSGNGWAYFYRVRHDH